jgi:hypothetical protein
MLRACPGTSGVVLGRVMRAVFVGSSHTGCPGTKLDPRVVAKKAATAGCCVENGGVKTLFPYREVCSIDRTGENTPTMSSFVPPLSAEVMSKEKEL